MSAWQADESLFDVALEHAELYADTQGHPPPRRREVRLIVNEIANLRAERAQWRRRATKLAEVLGCDVDYYDGEL